MIDRLDAAAGSEPSGQQLIRLRLHSSHLFFLSPLSSLLFSCFSWIQIFFLLVRLLLYSAFPSVSRLNPKGTWIRTDLPLRLQSVNQLTNTTFSLFPNSWTTRPAVFCVDISQIAATCSNKTQVLFLLIRTFPGELQQNEHKRLFKKWRSTSRFSSHEHIVHFPVREPENIYERWIDDKNIC